MDSTVAAHLLFSKSLLRSVLDLGHHIYADRVSAALKLGRKECIEYLHCELAAENSCTEADNVGVVVSSCHLRGEGVGAERRSDALILV